MIKTNVNDHESAKIIVNHNSESPILKVSWETFNKLIKYIYPRKTDAEIEILFNVLDFTNDGCLSINLSLNFYLRQKEKYLIYNHL